jgi:hypothetical protein
MEVSSDHSTKGTDRAQCVAPIPAGSRTGVDLDIGSQDRPVGRYARRQRTASADHPTLSKYDSDATGKTVLPPRQYDYWGNNCDLKL